MKIIPIKTERVDINPEGKLSYWIEKQLKNHQEEIQEGDIFVITSKIVSYFENRVVDLKEIQVSKKAREISERMGMPEELTQIVLNEADQVIAETPWVLLAVKNGIYCANAGVDVSNVKKGHAVLWPKDASSSSKKIQVFLKKRWRRKKIGVIISDSICVPGRKGTIAVAIGYSGINGYQELKEQRDLFENILRYSALNIVDSLSTAANLLMGEGRERAPLAIVRGYEWKSSAKTKNDEMIISPSDDMFPV